jgi:hypothetical protein
MSSAVLVGTSLDAFALERKGEVTTRRGTYTTEGSAGCADGTCSRSSSVTGPDGKTVSSQGSVTKTGPGQYSRSKTTTGPNGGTVNKSGSVTVTPPAD